MQRCGIWGKLFIFLTLMMLPSIAWANKLTIIDVETPQENSSAEEAKLSVYFDLRSGSQMPITGITADNCSILIEGKKPEVVRTEMVPFVEGEMGVGVLFIFPIAKNYQESEFAIRTHLKGLLQKMDRKIDQVNAVTYERQSTSRGWTVAAEKTLMRYLDEVSNTDEVEPNFFGSFATAMSAFDSLKNVSQKYLVIISDAEGANFGNNEQANTRISEFIDKLKKANIIPIVIAYSPDGRGAMSNIHHIQRIATELGGYYFLAESESNYQSIILSDVYNCIYSKYLLKTTLNMDGDSYLEQGKNYNLQLVVKTSKDSNDEDKAAIKINWPKLKKNRLWLWLLISGVIIVGACATVFIIMRRRQEDEIEAVDEGPQVVCCATCGKEIPQQLYGFNGEFCLSGGLPDCPYYQMPDRGKIQITRGPMADTTFFIKKDVTTIGSYPENDIYLADKSVSRKHAAIKTDEGKRYEIRDFGSSNGLYINNEKIERKFLRDGDLIRFGTVETVFKLK